MRALSGVVEPDKVADAIIHQPSVRTMLLTQKAILEGGRSMLYECAKVADHMTDCEAANDHVGAKAYDEKLAFLTVRASHLSGLTPLSCPIRTQAAH